MAKDYFRELRKEMKKQQLDVDGLAELCGCSKTTMYSALRGAREWTLEEMYIVLDALGMPYEAMPKIFPRHGIQSADGKITVFELERTGYGDIGCKCKSVILQNRFAFDIFKCIHQSITWKISFCGFLLVLRQASAFAYPSGEMATECQGFSMFNA